MNNVLKKMLLMYVFLITLFFSCSPVDNNPEPTPTPEPTPNNIALGLSVSTSGFSGTQPANLGNATDGDDATSTTAGITAGGGTEGFITVNLGNAVQGILYVKIGMYMATGTTGRWTLKTSNDGSDYNEIWETTTNPLTEVQYYISEPFWGQYIAVTGNDIGSGSVALKVYELYVYPIY